MSLLTEHDNNSLQEALHQGINTLSRHQTLTFTQYKKFTFSEDGSVFWVATPQTLDVRGSLHYGSETLQEEDQTIGQNAVLFTAEEEVTAFNVISPTTLWVCCHAVDSGDEILIAFSRRAPLYEQAGIWHYSGFAVYPALRVQLVKSGAALPTAPIVSNSLPIWLNLPNVLNTMPGITVPDIPVYASFLVPDNVRPPYIVAHIEPGMTEALQQFPSHDWTIGTNPQTVNSWQLAKDFVRLTFYGLNNADALNYQSALIEYSLNTDEFGFMSSPVLQDEKRTQSEISTIAQKKTLTLNASYYMNTADTIARRLIQSATMEIII
jgi:hypothetical protein